MALFLTGCKLELPTIDAGSLECHSTVSGRDHATTQSLTKSQVDALMSWLRAHDTGWTQRLEDTAPGLLVHLKRGNTPVAVVNILEREVKVKDLFRVLTQDERTDLLALLEPRKGHQD